MYKCLKSIFVKGKMGGPIYPVISIKISIVREEKNDFCSNFKII